MGKTGAPVAAGSESPPAVSKTDAEEQPHNGPQNIDAVPTAATSSPRPADGRERTATAADPEKKPVADTGSDKEPAGEESSRDGERSADRESSDGGTGGVATAGDETPEGPPTGFPAKLLRPVADVKLSKRDTSRFSEDDRELLAYINRKRQAAGLQPLPTLPTGLNDYECLQLLNGRLREAGEEPLPTMPTGAVRPKNKP